MTVSIETTSKKYRGKMASGYEAKRIKQERWHEENRLVEQMLTALHPRSVLDVPVGTGRFLHVYRILKVVTVTGVDSSEVMLGLAQRKLKNKKPPPAIVLKQGDARQLETLKDADVVVCVRFLDLIDEKAMRAVMKSITQRAPAVILTIRLGAKYVPKSNTAEHDEKKFRALVRDLGFAVAEEHPIFSAGWRVMLIKRRAK